MYNPNYYNNGKMNVLRGQNKNSILTFSDLSDNNIVAIFQGTRGERPDLDFVVKILMPGVETRPTTPSHAHIATDLFIKATMFPDEISEFIDYYIDFYNKCKPFDSIEERANYIPQSIGYVKEHFLNVKVPKTLAIETVGLIIELFCLCEKRTTDAHQFQIFLNRMKKYALGEMDYIRIINLVTKFREY